MPAGQERRFARLRECGLFLRTRQWQQRSARLRADEFDERFPGLLRAVLDNLDGVGGAVGPGGRRSRRISRR